MCRQKTGPSGAILVPFLGSLAVQQIEKEEKRLTWKSVKKQPKYNFRKPGKLLLNTTLKMTRMSGSLKAQYGEMRSDLTLHSTAHCT